MSLNNTKLIKYSLVVTDIIICLSGLIMLIAGSVIQGQINSQKLSQSIGGYSTPAGSIVCIIFGIFVLLFGLFGLYSALRDKYRFLMIYSGVMSFVFLVQFVTGIVGLSVKNSSKFDKYVENVFANELNINATDIKERDFYQEFFKCCGWNGVNDYRNQSQVINAPQSCCKNKEACDVTFRGDLFADSCDTKLINASKHVIEVVCAILVTFSIFNFFSIILSFLLARQIRNGYQYT